MKVSGLSFSELFKSESVLLSLKELSLLMMGPITKVTYPFLRCEVTS